MPNSKEGLDVVYDEVPSAQSDASFIVQAVEGLRGYESGVADVAGEFFHVDKELHFASAIGEEQGEEVLQPFFCVA